MNRTRAVLMLLILMLMFLFNIVFIYIIRTIIPSSILGVVTC